MRLLGGGVTGCAGYLTVVAIGLLGLVVVVCGRGVVAELDVVDFCMGQFQAVKDVGF